MPSRHSWSDFGARRVHERPSGRVEGSLGAFKKGGGRWAVGLVAWQDEGRCQQWLGEGLDAIPPTAPATC